MRVFVTGATGFVGSAVVRELLDAGHRVVGLARSDASAASLAAAGAEVHRGALDDPDGLARAAAASDGVVHTAFGQVSDDYAGAARADRTVVEALGAALAGSDRPLVVTSATALLPPGRLVTERDVPDPGSVAAVRTGTEQATLAAAGRGVRASVLRLPASVHGAGDHGFVPRLVDLARERGVSGYPDDGAGLWPAVHRFDAARLYRLAVEAAPAGAVLHAVAEEGIGVREIAEVAGRGLGLPVRGVPADAMDEHFGWLAPFLRMDNPTSGAATRDRLGWTPTRPGLLADLAQAEAPPSTGRLTPLM